MAPIFIKLLHSNVCLIAAYFEVWVYDFSHVVFQLVAPILGLN
jgi:hypothetical protein